MVIAGPGGLLLPFLDTRAITPIQFGDDRVLVAEDLLGFFCEVCGKLLAIRIGHVAMLHVISCIVEDIQAQLGDIDVPIDIVRGG